jgi:hypothetical protein
VRAGAVGMAAAVMELPNLIHRGHLGKVGELVTIELIFNWQPL